MMRSHLRLVPAIFLFASFSYWIFPGHVYLYEDMPIYLPMLARLWDPTFLRTDFVATRSHLAFTIYGEAPVAFSRLTGFGFREILPAEQFLFRALGILGVYLIGRASRLSERMALFLCGIFSLGATNLGCSVASLEFEPVPRGFAFLLILLALGLVANGRYVAAGIAGAVAFLFHVPATWPFWLLYLGLVLWLGPRSLVRRQLAGFVPLVCAGILLFVVSRPVVKQSPPEPFFRRLDPMQESLQRMLAPYNWISLWPVRWIEHHVVLAALVVLAIWSLRKGLDNHLRYFLLGLTSLGVLTMPASYLLLERLHWSFIAEFQPMRVLLYVAVVGGIATAAAGINAAQEYRYGRAFLWFAVAYAIPTEPYVWHILLPRLSSLGIPDLHRRVMSVAGFAALACLVVRWQSHQKTWARLALMVAAILPFFVLRWYCGVNQFRPRDTPAVEQLSAWARTETPKDSMFLFPDAGESSDPTIFRALALRSVYADWRSQGQINYFRDFALEWWARWQSTMAHPFDPAHPLRFVPPEVDHIVVQPGHRIPGGHSVFESPSFLVYPVSLISRPEHHSQQPCTAPAP